MQALETIQRVQSNLSRRTETGNKMMRETILFQKAINATAADLYQQMCAVRNKENKNFVFFTPNLIASLSMLYAGAPENLKTVMEQALHMGELKEQSWHNNFQNWSEGIQDRCRAQSMLKADQQKLKFQQTQIIASHANTPLVEQARSHLMYYSPEMVTFSDPEEARKLINDRVAQKTEGKIQNLVEDVPEDLVLLMASAALFKGQWQYPFDKAKNSEEVFSNSDGSFVRIEMMNNEIDDLRIAHDYNRTKGHAMSILELPFHGDVSLLLFKPELAWGAKSQEHAINLQKYMTESTVQELLENYEKRFEKTEALTVGIPKVNLKDKTDILRELHHTQLAQTLVKANFSNTLLQMEKPSITPGLVSEVNFTMDEEGAAVAAASYSPTYFESCDPVFKLTVPFGLAIVDRTTQTILGMGQVLQMEGEKVEKK